MRNYLCCRAQELKGSKKSGKSRRTKCFQYGKVMMLICCLGVAEWPIVAVLQ
jgi:hypothetical protein